MSKEIKVGFPGGKKISANINGHDVITDQPPSNGGDGSAPSPFDFFLASLATCGGFYASEFCNKRGIDMNGFSMRMVCLPNPKTRLYGKIVFELDLPAHFPEDQIEALKRSINSCAVKKHIVDAPEFEISVSEAVEAG